MASTKVTLVMGDMNLSTWSARPWSLLKVKGIEFETRKIMFGKTTDPATPAFRSELDGVLAAANPMVPAPSKVPALVDGDIVVWDSLAVCEYLAEKYPDKGMWPADPRARAIARSVVAEMHSGFQNLRSGLTGNVTLRRPDMGERLLRDHPGIKSDVSRIVAIWTGCLRAYGGPFLFGDTFTIADAYYVPVVCRFVTYGVKARLPPAAQTWMDTILALPAMVELVAIAESEGMYAD